ncbi:hypothetical protein WDU94_013410 [Cyamophila willieti]
MLNISVIIFALTVASLMSSGLGMPQPDGGLNGSWETQQGDARVARQAQGFGRGGGGQGGFGGQGGYGIQNWYNTPEGWGYDSTYPGGETHFHSKRGGGGGFGGQRGGIGAQRGGFGGNAGFY